MNRSLARLVLFVGALELAGGVASAQTLIDNLGEKTRGASVMGGTAKSDWVWAAQSFGTPTAYSLVSIDAIMGNRAGSATPVFELRVGADPTGPAAAVFSAPELSETSLEVVTLVPDVAVTLEPGEMYWLVVASPPSPVEGSFQWAYAQGNNLIGPGFFGSYFYSNDDVEWFDFGGDNPYQLRVNVWSSCRADFNADGAVNSQDFFDFLAVFFASDLIADFNADAVVNSQDFFDFLTALFSGC
jgi:hypothetical protein